MIQHSLFFSSDIFFCSPNSNASNTQSPPLSASPLSAFLLSINIHNAVRKKATVESQGAGPVYMRVEVPDDRVISGDH